MTANPSKLAAIGYAVESAFAEDSDSYTVRLQPRNATLDVTGLRHPLMDPGGVFQRIGEMSTPVRGVQEASFEIELDWVGHGGATNGALTQTDLDVLLDYWFEVDSTQIGGLLTAGTNDVNTLTSTNTTLLEGGLIRVGVPGDTRADGQASVLADATSAYELLCDLPAAPTTADNVRAMTMIYPRSAATWAATPMSSLRFWLATANKQWIVHGCTLTGIRWTVAQGQIMRVALTITGAWWEDETVTFPSATATAQKEGIVHAGQGSVFVQAKGTTTRATVQARDMEFSVGLEVAIIEGTGGVGSHQTIVGYRQTGYTPRISWSQMAPAASDTPAMSAYWNTTEGSLTAKHILVTFAATDGRAAALYLPDALPEGDRPTQIAIGNINYERVTWVGRTNSTTTNDLTLSAWRWGRG